MAFDNSQTPGLEDPLNYKVKPEPRKFDNTLGPEPEDDSPDL